MMGKIVQRFPYSLRARLLAKMDVKVFGEVSLSGMRIVTPSVWYLSFLARAQELGTIGESLEICIWIPLRAFPRLL
jgi:hypothetical protein